MHVIVLGAGVVGVTTAYYLAELGCRVTVIDRADEVASGASHANGGQLSYSFTDSLARPGFLSKIPGAIVGRETGSKVRVAPALVSWGSRFISQCSLKRSSSNTLSLLETAMRSAQLMADIRQKIPFDFSFRRAGKLVLLSNDDELRTAERTTALKQAHGSDAKILSPDDAIKLEPALQHFTQPFRAAIYAESDDVADARQFVEGMCAYLRDSGRVEFRMTTAADHLLRKGQCVVGVDCGEKLHADATVVALGAWSGELLRTVGINPHIYPVRGYSVTLPTGSEAPSVSITSLKGSFVITRLNGAMRIAGFADFRGFDNSSDQRRIGTLLKTAQRFAPEAADYTSDDRMPWGGFRPMTPSGRPCVGPTAIKGLYLNTGHGMLGWTLACATGRDAADAVTAIH